MCDEETIKHLKELLATYRRRLAHLLKQVAAYGSMSSAPLVTVHDIREARNGIRRSKKTLRDCGFHIEDHPDDEEQYTEKSSTLPTSTSYIPHLSNSAFLGRDKEIKRIDALFNHPGTVVVLTGIGGSGKTQLAVQYAYRCIKELKRWPGGVIWVQLDEAMVKSGGMESALIQACHMIGIHEDIDSIQRLWNSPTPRLLIFDACPSMDFFYHWRPVGGNSRVLITSTRTDWDDGGPYRFSLEGLPRELARRLLVRGWAKERKTSIEEAAANPVADEICQELGDLPLAIHVSSAYLAHFPNKSLDIFLKELQDQNIDHEALSDEGRNTPTGHVKDIASTFALSYAILLRDDQPVNRNARYILAIMTYFPPELSAPLTLLHHSARKIATKRQIDEACAILNKIGLVTYVEKGQALSIHRLVAKYVLKKHENKKYRDIENIVILALKEMTSDLQSNQNRVDMPLLLPLANHAVNQAIEHKSIQAAPLLNNLGLWHRSVNNLEEAKKHLKRALDTDKGIFGEDHFRMALWNNNLGNMFLASEELDRAEEVFYRALAIDKATYGINRSVARDLNNLGLVAYLRDNLKQAHSYFNDAIQIASIFCGHDHLDIAIYAKNFGDALFKSQLPQRAIIQFNQSLRILKRKLESEHPLIHDLHEKISQTQELLERPTTNRETTSDQLND